jgi:GTPase SAR1 family protein
MSCCEIPPLRILLIGDSQCGKSTLANAFSEKTVESADDLRGFSQRSKPLMHDGAPVILNVLDRCQETTPVSSVELQRLWRDGAVDVFVLCFVLGDAASWTRVTDYWLEQMKDCSK